MLSSAYNLPSKMKVSIGILKPLCIELMTGDYRLMTASGTAVASAERFAAFVAFQWQQASLPPHKNDHSAVSPVLPACHFSGSNANNAANAVIAATTATYSIF